MSSTQQKITIWKLVTEKQNECPISPKECKYIKIRVKSIRACQHAITVNKFKMWKQNYRWNWCLSSKSLRSSDYMKYSTSLWFEKFRCVRVACLWIFCFVLLRTCHYSWTEMKRRCDISNTSPLTGKLLLNIASWYLSFCLCST